MDNSGNRQYNQFYQNQQYSPGNDMRLEPPLTLGNWLIIMLIGIIPFVNIVMLFIWAFGNTENTSKRNYARAMLIFYAIGLVLSLIFGSILASMINTIFNSAYYY